jgi:hypothetical protein
MYSCSSILKRDVGIAMYGKKTTDHSSYNEILEIQEIVSLLPKLTVSKIDRCAKRGFVQ